MCGIGGILVYEGRSLPGDRSLETLLDTMVKALAHRGPDDHGIAVLAPVDRRGPTLGLAHTRLSIIDLSPAGHQPMRDPHGNNRIVFNGEVYNYKELRQRLSGDFRGVAWRSSTDTEVILQAYAAWGKEGVEQLGGMFAFGLWDDAKRELFLARDRFGQKPLYYYQGQGFFAFSSEVRALLATGLAPKVLDPVALWQYLGYQSAPSPRTMVEGVRMLPPGCWLSVRANGETDEHRYWDLLGNASPDAGMDSPAQAQQRVRELLQESVKLHLVSDVPVAAFLSGGIDSTAVVALMREGGVTPRTFSVVFGESHRTFDEARFSRLAASRFACEHTEVLLHDEALLRQLPEALGAMDQPTGDGVNTYIVSKAVRDAGVKVSLSGLGGDELFAGYPSFARLQRSAGFRRLWGHTPSGVRSLAGRAVSAMGGSVKAAKAGAFLGGDGTLATAYPLLRQVLSPAQRRGMLQDNVVAAIDGGGDPYVDMLREELAKSPNAGVLAQVSYAEARTYMHDVLLRDTDQMSMAHALEVRVPLLDHRLAEYVMGLPDAYKQSNGTPKRLLVRSLDGLLPQEIVQRPKQGFTLPFDPWMRGALRQFSHDRMRRLGQRGIFRPQALDTLWGTFQSGDRGVSWSRLWVLVALDEWLERTGVQAPG